MPIVPRSLFLFLFSFAPSPAERAFIWMLHSLYTYLFFSRIIFMPPHVFSYILTPKMVSWQHGDEDTIIFNIDGSVLTNLKKMGYGGLICKHDGSFQLGFFGNVRISNILHAEIQAIENLCTLTLFMWCIWCRRTLHISITMQISWNSSETILLRI